LYEWGSETRLAVRDPEFAKEVLTVKQAYFTKPQMNKYIVGDIVGHESLAIVDDPQHATQRRILNSFFYAEALKVG
jgi:cytochrome P450